MLSNQAQSIVEKIDKDWASKAEVRELCRAILSFVIKPPRKALLTYTMIRNGTGIDSSSATFASAVEYLMGDVQVLELTFEILGDDGFPVPISAEEAATAHDRSINPITGHFQEDIAKHILTYFRPSGALDLE